MEFQRKKKRQRMLAAVLFQNHLMANLLCSHSRGDITASRNLGESRKGSKSLRLMRKQAEDCDRN